jgi:hypothetical protein
MPATATGRGAQVVLDPSSATAQAVRGAYAATMEANRAKVAADVLAGVVSDGTRQDGTTATGGVATDVAATPMATLTVTGSVNAGSVNAGHIGVSAGIDFGSQLSAGPQDFSKHINLYGGQFGICVDNGGNTAYTASASHTFWMGTSQVGYINSTGLNIAIGQQIPNLGTFSTVQVGSTSGPTWTTGSAAPAASAPVGSLYSRVGGAVGATLYVSRGGGTWAAVAGV